MPLDIGSSLQPEDVRRIDVNLPHYNTTIWVDYDPSKYDWRLEKLMVLDSERLPATAIREFIRSFVVDWDLMENGKPIDPKDDDQMVKVDFFHIQAMVANAILEDIQEGKALPNGSQPRSSTVKQRQKGSRVQEASLASL